MRTGTVWAVGWRLSSGDGGARYKIQSVVLDDASPFAVDGGTPVPCVRRVHHAGARAHSAMRCPCLSHVHGGAACPAWLEAQAPHVLISTDDWERRADLRELEREARLREAKLAAVLQRVGAVEHAPPALPKMTDRVLPRTKNPYFLENYFTIFRNPPTPNALKLMKSRIFFTIFGKLLKF